MKDLVI